MRIHGSTRPAPSRHRGAAAGDTALTLGVVVAPSRSSPVVGVPPDREIDRRTEVSDDRVRETPAAPPAELDRAGRSTRPTVLSGSGSVEDQLRRLEARLLAEVGGDTAAERAVRLSFSASCARFATARVRRFVPILVEREVRERLRNGVRSA